jgi:ABC-type uncharacterized transport system involved in gliding motility auxiliary subunit
MKRVNFRLAFALVTILLLGIAIFLNAFLGNMRAGRVDMTEDRLFTLSPSAKTILQRLQVPVQVKYYVTRRDKMPTELKNLERDVTDKLQDFASASGGYLDFSVHDPSDDEELQELLLSKGIRPFQVQSVERDEIGLKLIFSAISIAYKDAPEEVLPQVLPQSLATIEYELVSRVYRLTQDSQPVVAVYAPKPQLDPQMLSMYMQMGQQPPEMPDTWQSLEELLRSEHYDVRRIELTEASPIPPETDALLVFGPRDLNARQVYEIERALSRGVNTIMAIQRNEYAYNPAPRGGFSITASLRNSGLEGTLGRYGINVSSEQLFDAESEVISIPRTQNLLGMRVQTAEPVRAPMQIAVRGTQMNRELDMTNRIEQLFYLWGTNVEIDPQRQMGLKMAGQVLFTASDKAWRRPFSADPLTMADVDTRGQDFEPGLALAYLFEGQFPEPSGEMPDWPGAAIPDEEGAEPAEAGPDTLFGGVTKPARLVLTGCAKLFEDPFLGAGHNSLLLLNSVDALALGGDLIGIRSKVITQRTLKPVEAGEKLLFRLFTVALVPLLLALFGLVRMFARRKESALYRENLNLRTR